MYHLQQPSASPPPIIQIYIVSIRDFFCRDLSGEIGEEVEEILLLRLFLERFKQGGREGDGFSITFLQVY